MALIRKARAMLRHLDPCIFELSAQRIEIVGGGNLPTHEGQPLASLARDDQALLAVVHAEQAGRSAAIDFLHAEQAGGESFPVGGLGRIDPDVTQ